MINIKGVKGGISDEALADIKGKSATVVFDEIRCLSNRLVDSI